MLPMKINDNTCNGRCSNCGSCCSDMLPISDNEIIRIRKYIRKHNIKEYRHNGRMGADLTCPFRDEQKKVCTIYPVRPEICQTFMCNHTLVDIAKSKIVFHAKHRVVFMREEFFGNSEDTKWFTDVLTAIVKGEI